MRMEVPISKRAKKQIDSLKRRNQILQSRHRLNVWKKKTKQSKLYLATLFAVAEGICPFCEVDMYMDFVDTNELNKATLDTVDPLAETEDFDKLNLQIMCRKCKMDRSNEKYNF